MHNRGQFARGLVRAGVYIRNVGLAAPELLGRGERHGDIFKTDLKKCVKGHAISGKDKMNMAASVCCDTKNSVMRKGGVSPYQWVLGVNPRIPGLLTEGDEWEQLGVLEQRIDPGTALGIKAMLRNTSRKNFVKMDWSRRCAAALLRKSLPLPCNYGTGDLVMYHRKQGSGQHAGDTWQGLAHIIGFENKVPMAISRRSTHSYILDKASTNDYSRYVSAPSNVKQGSTLHAIRAPTSAR